MQTVAEMVDETKESGHLGMKVNARWVSYWWQPRSDAAHLNGVTDGHGRRVFTGWVLDPVIFESKNKPSQLAGKWDSRNHACGTNELEFKEIQVRRAQRYMTNRTPETERRGLAGGNKIAKRWHRPNGPKARADEHLVGMADLQVPA